MKIQSTGDHMKRIYLSGPMTGMPDFNFPAFNAEAARLRALGYDVINPGDINPDTTTPYNECLRNDLKALLDCDTIAMLENWMNSNGAHLEMHIAHRVGIRVVEARTIVEKSRHTAPADTYPAPEHGWTCFHCGENFKTPGAAREHFGPTPNAEPGCLIRVSLGGERGLLNALRNAEKRLAMHMDEDSELARVMHAMQSRHADALTAAEEAGYARGLRDGMQHVRDEVSA